MAKTGQSASSGSDIWNRQGIFDFAPDDASIVAALKVLKKGGFGTVEATADGKGWWVVCQGITDIYQVSARVEEGQFACDCTCPSPKYPCKHALALLLYLSDHPEERAEPEAPKYAPTDFEALVRSVFQNPKEDTPRLVFADFLEENDEPDRAALIRLQCELAREKPRSPRGAELKKQLRGLEAKVRRKTLDPLPEGVEVEFDRGFLQLTTDRAALREIGSLPARFTSLFQDGWVEVVRIDEYFDVLSEGHTALFGLIAELDFTHCYLLQESALLSLAAQFAEMRESGRLARIKLRERDQKEFDDYLKALQGATVAHSSPPREVLRHYGGLTPQSLDLLIRSGRLRAARHLQLQGAVGDRGAELLAHAELSGVDSLILDGWNCTAEGLRQLAESSALAGLYELGISTWNVGAEGIAALVNGPAMGNIRRLSLIEIQLDDAAAVEVAHSQRLRNLTSLSLGGNELSPIGLRQILDSPNQLALAHIDITGSAIVESYCLNLLLGARPRSEFCLALGSFELTRRCEPSGDFIAVEHPSEVRVDHFERLAKCAGTSNVAGLRITRASIGPEALGAIASTFSPTALKELEFRNVPLRNEGVVSLVAAFKDYRLETLRLPYCRIQASGVATLAYSPVMESVKVLDLAENTIGKRGAEALVKSPLLGNIERLELTDLRVGLEERKALKAKFGAKLVI